MGAFEYWKIRTVLQRVDSADQLHQIEINSPHIRGEDAELWQAMIARDVPNWRTKNYAPKNPLNWYKVYCKYKKEQAEEIKRDEEILRNTMMGLNKQKETYVPKVMDLRTLPKLPRDPRMRKNNGGVPLVGKGFRKEGVSTLNFTSGSKTKITDGRSVLTKARREAKEISAMGKLAKPTHQLKGRMGQVVRAPAAMMKEYQVANQPAVKILSRKHLSVRQFEGGITGPSLEEREKRLRAMQTGQGGSSTAPTSSANATLVGSSDSEDDADGLFDEDDDDDDEPRSQSTMSSRTYQSTPPRKIAAPSRPSSYQTSSSPPLAATKPLAWSMSSAPAPSSRGASPAVAPKPMIAKRRAEVDVFNRGAKKPRR